jgi:hypothetical protein
MAFTTPGTAVAGEVLTAAFWNTNVRDNLTEFAPMFATWTTYTPVVNQGASSNIAKTVVYARYLKIGRMVAGNFRINMTASGTSGSNVVVTLPFPTITTGMVIGSAWIYDASTNTSYTCAYNGQENFLNDAGIGGAWGSGPSIALANDDRISANFMYETTS